MEQLSKHLDGSLWVEKKRDYISTYAVKLKYVYGDMDEILHKCERHTKNFTEEKLLSTAPIAFEDDRINKDASEQ